MCSCTHIIFGGAKLKSGLPLVLNQASLNDMDAKTYAMDNSLVPVGRYKHGPAGILIHTRPADPALLENGITSMKHLIKGARQQDKRSGRERTPLPVRYDQEYPYLRGRG